MRDAAISGALAFVTVLVLAAAVQPPAPAQATPTPLLVAPLIKCGVPEPECQKLAADFIARVQAATLGVAVASIVVLSADSFDVCFTDGTCRTSR